MQSMNSNWNLLKSSILAGICIGIAGVGYLSSCIKLSNGELVGSIVFAFGLLAVVHYGLKLFTGTAGFISKSEIDQLSIILIGNIIGCFLVSILSKVSTIDITTSATRIWILRLDAGPIRNSLLSIGCGFIMTTAVAFAKKDKYLPLLFGVPLFIISGFPHCIADCYYLFSCSYGFIFDNFLFIIINYIFIIFGNFIGCNLYRLLIKTN